MDKRAVQQWREYFETAEEMTPESHKKPKSFVDALKPLVEFARFMDDIAVRINSETPFRLEVDRGQRLEIGVNSFDLGVVDNFKGTLLVNSKTRTMSARFVPTLEIWDKPPKVGKQTKCAMTYVDPVDLIHEQFNIAKAGVKAVIENKRRLMRHYEKLEVEPIVKKSTIACKEK